MGLSPDREGEYSRRKETRQAIRATVARLQQRVVSANRRARWRSSLLAIGANKEPSDGNHEIDCRRKMASFAVPTAGNKAAIEASSDALEASIAA